MKYVRVRARIRTGAEDVGFRQNDPFEVDLKIKSDNIADPYGRMYGAFGNHAFETYYPFMMNKNGVIDFGYGDGTRNARTDLIDKEDSGRRRIFLPQRSGSHRRQQS